MRKFLSLTFMFLAATFWAKAQDAAHWTYQEGQYENETFVYADVTVYTETATGFDETALTTASDYNAYEYAAFVEGDLRGVATIVANNSGDIVTYLLRFRIEGGADDIDGNITFKAYDKAANRELDLNPESEQPMFTGETIDPGIPSNPLHLQITYPMESVAVNSITTPFIGFDTASGAFVYIECNVGDDLTPYFVDGQAFSVLPAEASNKAVTFELYETETSPSLTIDKAGNIIAATTGLGVVKVTSVDNPQATCLVYVLAYNDIKTMTVTQDELTVTYQGQPVEFSEQLMSIITFGEGETIGGETTFVSSATDVVEINENGAYAYKTGEAVITITLPVVDRLMKTFNPNGNHTTYVTATITITVVQGLTGLHVEWPTSMATEQYSNITVSPLPEGAQFSKKGTFTISGYYLNYSDATITSGCYYDDGPGQGIGWVYGEIPGELTLTVTYDDGEGTVLSEDSEVIECGYTFGMNEGWEWRTIPYANFSAINSLTDIFGTELIEIRTQSSQLYNDPVYGYFGDNGLLSQNMGFKLKMGELTVPPSLENVKYLKSYVFYGGSLGMNNEITLRKGWNYLPNPYVLPMAIDDALAVNKIFVEGDRIVSKESGFAEYANGQWTGDLTSLQPGQGYLFYNAGDANRTIIYDDEFRAPSSRRMAPRRAPMKKVWNYDARRFSDNMTIVATINGQYSLVEDQWTVGAFVGDECRGEGVAVDGRLFITVHANSGELISFKLRNEISGELFNIDQTVPMQQMLGTVKQPFSMTASESATGIDNLSISGFQPDSRCYDLQGRPVNNRQPVNGQLRIVDGKKVVK